LGTRLPSARMPSRLCMSPKPASLIRGNCGEMCGIGAVISAVGRLDALGGAGC
jgi:hypothetical protein